MILDKTKLQKTRRAFLLDNKNLAATVWNYEDKAGIIVFDKDKRFEQDFYYVVRGAMPEAGAEIDKIEAITHVDNPSDAYVLFQDYLDQNKSEEQKKQEQEEDEKASEIPVFLKDRTQNTGIIRKLSKELKYTDEITPNVSVEKVAAFPKKSVDTFTTELFIDGVEAMTAVFIRNSEYDNDNRDAYLMVPATPPDAGGQEAPQDQTKQDKQPLDFIGNFAESKLKIA